MILCSTFLFTVSTEEPKNEEIAIGVTGNLGGENELQPMATAGCVPPTRIVGWTDHAVGRLDSRGLGQYYLEFIFRDATPTWSSYHQSWNYTDGTDTICVNSAGWVTTVYWNNDR